MPNANTKRKKKTDNEQEVHGIATVIFDGMLNIRNKASWNDNAIAGRIIKGSSYVVDEMLVVDKKPMFKLLNGMFITADEKLVRFEKL